jgi:pilus assembly protein CpaD
MKPSATPASVIRLGLLAALAGLLAACAPTLQDSQWTGADTPKQNKVLYLRQAHEVRFEAGKETLSPAEQQRLAAFLAREEVGRSDEISLAAGGDGKEQTLAARRAAAVAGYLRGLNLKPEPDATSTAPADRVTVSVGRYVVVPPNCPDWRKPSTDDPANSPSSNFGCATATNLGLMVADPHDLISGKASSESDAEYNALAVRRYREGTIKEPHFSYEGTPDAFQLGTGIQEKK